MRGLTRRAHELAIGSRVAAGRGRSTDLQGETVFDEIRIERIVDIDRDAQARQVNVRVELAHGDDRRVAMLCHTGWADRAVAPCPWETLWTEALPEDDAVAAEFVAGMHAGRRSRDAALFWVGASDGEVAYAHLLTDGIDDERHRLLPTPGGLARSEHAIAIRADAPIGPRSVVMGSLAGAECEAGLCIQAIGSVRTLLNDVDLDAAAAAFPVDPTPPNHYMLSNLAGFYDLDDRSELAWARTEPSQALVLSWSDGVRQQVKCVATSGVAFYRNDDPEAYAEQSIPGVGLWVWSDVSYHGYQDHEGGWDADMDGDWRPATPADVEAMCGDVDAMESDIRDYTCEEGQDLVARYLALSARQAELEST